MNQPSHLPSTRPAFKILRIYLKGASVEVPQMADLPQHAISPNIGVDMQSEATQSGQGSLECVLRISLHARLGDKNVFMIEVSEAGVFELNLLSRAEAHRFARQIAPSVLFPFARKDLAGLAIAAGFQPILLDHVDFDSLLTQVVKSHRLAGTQEPMPVDLMVVQPAPAAIPATEQSSKTAPDAELDWPDTTPFNSFDVPPVSATLPRVESGKNRALKLILQILMLLGVASTATMTLWIQTSRPSTKTTMTVTPARILTAPAAAAPTPSPPAVVIPPDTLAALETSRIRLADQPKHWFTLNLGTVPASTPLNDLKPLPLDRPVYLHKLNANTLQVLYGVFPTQIAAEQVLNQMPPPESPKNQQVAAILSIGSL